MLQNISISNKCWSFEPSIHQRIWKFSQNLDFPQSILKWFLKDLKSGAMMLKIQLSITGIQLYFKHKRLILKHDKILPTPNFWKVVFIKTLLLQIIVLFCVPVCWWNYIWFTPVHLYKYWMTTTLTFIALISCSPRLTWATSQLSVNTDHITKTREVTKTFLGFFPQQRQ